MNSSQDVTFNLYDQQTTWKQTLTLQDVKQKVKALNKRFDFSDDNIKEALSGDFIQSAVIEEQPNTRAINNESCLLKIKYRIKNCLLNYEWTLKKQNLITFQQTFVQPLLLALLGCHQQVEFLTDIVRKKDFELKQFRIEGAELNRKTVITKPFDFDNFNKKYENCNEIAKHFGELAKHVKETVSKNNPDIINNLLTANTTSKTESSIKSTETLDNEQSTNTKMSPRQKKRKANELKMQYLEKHLKFCKKGLEYESSQSQTTSSGNSQAIEGTGAEDLMQEKQCTTNQHVTSKSENIAAPRRSSRCAPIKEKQDNMFSEDKTDSDSDDHFRTLRERKTTRSFLHATKDSPSIISTKGRERKTKVSNNTAEDTLRKCVKLSNISDVTRMKSTDISFETSNVSDFSPERKTDEILLERKRKTEDHAPLSKRKKLLTNERLISSFNEDCRNTSNTTSTLDCVPAGSVISMRSSSENKNLSQSPTPVAINELSSQLDNIKKELESLEAMRLADLQQRTCKV